jgi:hypothetical protein
MSYRRQGPLQLVASVEACAQEGFASRAGQLGRSGRVGRRSGNDTGLSSLTGDASDNVPAAGVGDMTALKLLAATRFEEIYAHWMR